MKNPIRNSLNMRQNQYNLITGPKPAWEEVLKLEEEVHEAARNNKDALKNFIMRFGEGVLEVRISMARQLTQLHEITGMC